MPPREKGNSGNLVVSLKGRYPLLKTTQTNPALSIVHQGHHRKIQGH